MNAVTESGRNPVNYAPDSARVWNMSGLTRGGTVESVSRDQVLRRERVQRKYYFSCSADHEQNWQPYPVDLHSAESADHNSDVTATATSHTAYYFFRCEAFLHLRYGASDIWSDVLPYRRFRAPKSLFFKGHATIGEAEEAGMKRTKRSLLPTARFW